MSPPITLYDVALEGTTDEERVWAPNTWRTRLTLNIKGLAHKTKWIAFTEVVETMKGLGLAENWAGERLRYSVPTITDHTTNRTIMGTQAIAQYLDEQYPNTPSLVYPGTRALNVMFAELDYARSVGPIFKLLMSEHCDACQEKDKAYYMKSRESMLNLTWDEMVNPSDTVRKGWLQEIEKYLDYNRGLVAQSGEGALFLGGDLPTFADTCVAAQLYWAYSVGGKDHALTKLIMSANGGWWAKYFESFSKWSTLY